MTAGAENSPAGRKHRREFWSAQRDSFRMQPAVRFDPPAHAFGISRPQDAAALGGDRLIALHVPGAVKYEAGARRDADAVSRNDSPQHGARRRAGAVDFDALA